MKNLGKKIVASLLLGTICIYTMPVLANTKDETVYSKVKNNGEKYSTIVSTKLTNNEKSELLEDLSNLLNIENTNGDETYKQDGEKIIWNANGNKIQYQGNTEKNLPVEMHIKYELDGKEIEAEDIAGKTGKVKITIEYINKDEHYVKVNGKTVKMYTPFVAMAGTIISNKSNEDIKVTQGKIVDNGNKTIVIGIAMPGMKESLGLNGKDIDISEKIEIEMNSKEFEMSNIITYLTPKIIDSKDLKMLENVDKIYSQVNKVQSSSKQLVEGANQIKDGSKALSNGTESLNAGINSAYNGISTMKTKIKESTSILQADKTNAIDEKTITAIGNQAKQTAINSLNIKENGNQTKLDEIGIAAKKGAEQTIAVKLPTIGEKAKQTANKEIQGQLTQIGENAKNQVTNQMKENINSIGLKAKQDAENSINLEAIGKTAESMVTIKLTDAQKAEITTRVTNQVKESLSKDENFKKMSAEEQAVILAYSQKTSVASAISSAEQTMQTAGKQVASKVAQNTAKQTAVTVAENVAKTVAGSVVGDVASQVSKSTAVEVAQSTAESTAKTIASTVAGDVAKETAKSVATQVTETVSSETAKNVAMQVGNEVKKNAMSQIVGQMNTLENGLETLSTGLEKLQGGSIQLLNGSKALTEGSNSLAEGMTEFDKQAIQTICNYINGDVKDITERLKALKKLAEEYNTFTKIKDGDEGTVKFIIVVDEIKK